MLQLKVSLLAILQFLRRFSLNVLRKLVRIVLCWAVVSYLSSFWTELSLLVFTDQIACEAIGVRKVEEPAAQHGCG